MVVKATSAYAVGFDSVGLLSYLSIKLTHISSMRDICLSRASLASGDMVAEDIQESQDGCKVLWSLEQTLPFPER